jgi:two-component system LytT family response regulator
MLSLVIIDDEPHARSTIRDILALGEKKINILGEAGDVRSARELILQKKPDLVLLDINLPDGTGFDLLKKFDTIDFRIIFITAHEEYAVRAFRFSALDYILKPIAASALLQAVEKAGEVIKNEKTEEKFKAFLANLEKINKIVLRTAESIHIINLENIIRCESDVNYTIFYLTGGEKLLVSNTLKEYDEMLGPSGFFRTHQSHLVNLDHILRYDKAEGGHLILDDGSWVPVSLRKKEQLFRIFEELG